MLRRHEECSDLFVDVLNFIEHRLLKLNPRERAKSGELVEAFESIYDKCLRDEAYCTARRRKLGREHEMGSPTRPAAATTPAVTHQPGMQKNSWGWRVWSFFRGLTGCLRVGNPHP